MKTSKPRAGTLSHINSFDGFQWGYFCECKQILEVHLGSEKGVLTFFSTSGLYISFI